MVPFMSFRISLELFAAEQLASTMISESTVSAVSILSTRLGDSAVGESNEGLTSCCSTDCRTSPSVLVLNDYIQNPTPADEIQSTYSRHFHNPTKAESNGSRRHSIQYADPVTHIAAVTFIADGRGKMKPTGLKLV
jgi:hypothetical protein